MHSRQDAAEPPSAGVHTRVNAVLKLPRKLLEFHALALGERDLGVQGLQRLPCFGAVGGRLGLDVDLVLMQRITLPLQCTTFAPQAVEVPREGRALTCTHVGLLMKRRVPLPQPFAVLLDSETGLL